MIDQHGHIHWLLQRRERTLTKDFDRPPDGGVPRDNQHRRVVQVAMAATQPGEPGFIGQHELQQHGMRVPQT